MTIIEEFMTRPYKDLYRLIKVNDNLWSIKKNFMVLHVCDTEEQAKNKFKHIKMILEEDNQVVKGGDTQ